MKKYNFRILKLKDKNNEALAFMAFMENKTLVNAEMKIGRASCRERV